MNTDYRSSRARNARGNRHLLAPPWASFKDAEIWENMMLKERVGPLFNRQKGLAGHVQQVQFELNRCTAKHMEGFDDQTLVSRVCEACRRVYAGIQEAKLENSHMCQGSLKLSFPLLSSPGNDIEIII